MRTNLPVQLKFLGPAPCVALGSTRADSSARLPANLGHGYIKAHVPEVDLCQGVVSDFESNQGQFMARMEAPHAEVVT